MNIRENAYAKVNWTLEVLGAFPEGHINAGYTQIITAMFLIDICDTVDINVLPTLNSELEICCDSPRIPQTSSGNVEKNCCYRAVQALRQSVSGFPDNDLRIDIQKNIPFAGGLGGSSTDGAAVLRGLNKLFALNLSSETLVQTAAKFGSDTAFFALDCPAGVAKGRGEIVTSLLAPAKPLWLILLAPGIEITATKAYVELSKAGFPNCGQLLDGERYSDVLEKRLNAQADAASLASCLYNDLERSPATLERHPVLPEMLAKMSSMDFLNTAMSGSGSTLFGVAESKSHAEQLADKLHDEYPKYEVIVTSTLN